MEFDEPEFDFDMPDTAEEILEEWERDDEIIAATKGIIEAEANLVEMEREANKLVQEANALTEEENELLNRLNKIRARKAAIQNKKLQGRSKWQREKDRKSALESKKRVAKENYERAKQAKAKFSEWEAKAESFAWGVGVKNGDETYKIMPHQLEGAAYIANYRRIILGDTMGTGKTLTSTAAMDLIGARRILVITPADISNNFVREIKMWAPHRTVFSMKGMTKIERKTTLDLANMLGDYVAVINYEIWRRDTAFLKQLIRSQFDAVIMDEAHVMKSSKGNAYQGVRDIVHATNQCPECGALLNWEATDAPCTECSFNPALIKESNLRDPDTNADIRCSVKTVLPMSGSPILNSPEDLYTLLNLIDPFNFSNQHVFLKNYAFYDFDGKWKFLTGGAERLLKSLSGKFLARSMEDAGVILPEQKPILHEIEIDPEEYPLQYRTIKQLSKAAAIMLDNGKTMPVMQQIAIITRQRQANVWPGGIKLIDPETKEIVFDVSEEVRESIKLDRALTMAEEFVSNGERVAIFSQFKTGLAELEQRLTAVGIRAARFDGDTPQERREEIKSNFDRKLGEEPKWDVILCNFKTGGVGLNLTAATQMIILDREWNPGKEEQAFKRISRIGQTERTFVHILQLSKTIDEWHAGLINQKREMIEGFNEQQQDLQELYLQALKSGEIM